MIHMNDRKIFQHLFDECKKSKDPEGVVAACLVKNGDIILSSPSADDGIRHAEDLLLEKAQKQNIPIDERVYLYTTLEPCSFRSQKDNIDDCTTLILGSGIRNIIYAAPDPEYSKDAANRFNKAKVNYRMVNDSEITKKAIDIFNSTIKIPLAFMHLPRTNKICK